MSEKGSKVCLSLVLFLFLLPMLATFIASFVRKNPEGNSFMISAIQYAEVLRDETMRERFANSFRLAGQTLLIQFPVSLLGGLFMNRAPVKVRRLVTLLFLTGLLLPFQTYMVPAYQLSHWSGVYDTHWAVVLLYGFSPFGSLMIAVLMQRIPEEQWEAASLDTRSWLCTYRTVVLPQLLPGLLVFLLLAFSEIWNSVEQPLILIRDNRLMPAGISLNDIRSITTGHSAAGAVLYALPILVLYLMSKRSIAQAGIGGGLNEKLN